ncbi:MAG: hypothetical protein ACE5K8_06645 [Candidatus Zixiibacteriota bacterium]
MKVLLTLTCGLALLCLAVISTAIGASVPGMINVQGKLTDQSGQPVPDAIYGITFSIYDVSSGGSALWQETRMVDVTDGLFSILLGQSVAIPPSLFDDTALWLGIKVGAESEMTPRQRLSTAPYAFRTPVSPAGVNWIESGSGGTISTDMATSNISSISIPCPSAGYVIVTASGSIWWNPSSSGQGMIRLKVSDTVNNVTEYPGVQFIRRSGFVDSSINEGHPFSITKVFTVSGPGTETYYLNAWHQVVNGTAIVDDYSLVGVFVPNRYSLLKE